MDNRGAPPPVRNGQGNFGGMNRGKPAEKPNNLQGTLLRLWRLTEGHRGGLGWIMLLSAFASASTILSPLLIGNAINALDMGEISLGFIIALLMALYVGDWLVRFLQQFFMASIGQKIILHIREVMFSVLKILPIAFFDKRQHGELMSRLTNDVDNISSTISDSLSQLMIYAFTIVGVLTIMLISNVQLTLVACGSVVLVFILTKIVTTHTGKLYKAQQAYLGALNGQVEESVSGLNMVKAFCREQAMIEQFEGNNIKYRDTATRAIIWSGYLMPLTTVINNLSFVSIAVVSGVMAAKGVITIGLISSFLLYSKQFSRPFVDIANIYNNFQSAVAGAERIFEILDEPPEPPDSADSLPLSAPRGDIEFRGVTFGYEPACPILKDFSLSVKAGTSVAIVGPTGSGKTTIINLLTRFYDVNGGSIVLDGHDLRDYRIHELRNAFGIVLQDSSLFGVSVRDNISYGHENIPLSAIKSAAIAAGADGFIQRLPDGYDTILRQGGGELSQGERQLLTIARAMLVNAPILILDEATSSVDTMTEQKIRSAILKITEGRTSFIIAHRLSTIRDSDVIIVINDGKILEFGTHDKLMEMDGSYASMYRTQVGL
ncbi:MAG: ABC transporter ATP-binding protein/permease [Oscillospiraceae bacterium]|jgi:ATP-binding cassette subfamily B protein|nr:ABC transporter ATP-binding protein/permease [Oscillospiraceae bacterium]